MGLFDFVGDFVGDLFGGGDNEQPKPAANPSADLLAQIANERYTAVKPLEKALLDQLMGFMGSGKAFDVTGLPQYASGRRSIMDSFKGAKDSILSMLPKGGTLMDSLANARIGSAKAIGDMGSNLAGDMYNKAYGFATGVPQQSQSGLGQAGSIYESGLNNALLNQQSQNDLLGSIGSGLGFAIDKIPWATVGSGLTSALSSLGSLFSTQRLKKDIVAVGNLHLKNGKNIPLVEYNYIWDEGSKKRVGVLAEDAFRAFPESVILGKDNLPLMVNYQTLGKEIAGVF